MRSADKPPEAPINARVLPETVSPIRVFGLVLLVVFVTEGAVMLVLPYFRSATSHPLVEGLVDASILTALSSYVVWNWLVRPLRTALWTRSALLDRLFDAQEMERAHVARELHDELGQRLTALQLHLRVLGEAQDVAAMRGQLNDVREMGLALHADVRRISRGLRPGALDQFGLSAAIERLVSEVNIDEDVEVSFEHEGCPDARPDREVESAIYRVCQEAITNSLRHGAPSTVNVALRCGEDGLTLTVMDDGRGFDVALALSRTGTRAAFGLLSMRERTRLLGGTFDVRSVPGQGTTLSVRFPASLVRRKNG